MTEETKAKRKETYSRDRLVAEVKHRVKTKNLFKHILAVEAVMVRLAKHFGEDESVGDLQVCCMISIMRKPKTP